MDKQRSTQQNRWFYKAIRQLAEDMEAAGLDMRTVIRVPIKPTVKNVKSEMVDPIMMALYPDRESSTELTTKELTELMEVLNRATSEKLGIAIMFPKEGENEN